MFIKIFDTIYNTREIVKVEPPYNDGGVHYVRICLSSNENRIYKFSNDEEASDFYLQLEDALVVTAEVYVYEG